MTKAIKKVTLMVLAVCLMLAVSSIGYAAEVALVYEGGAEIGIDPVVIEAPAAAAEAFVYTPSEPQQTYGNENQEKWYSVSFHDLEGNEIWYYSLREGETVYSPDFIPYWNGLVFQFWFDYNQAGTHAPFLFGEGIHRDLVLVPYYLYEENHFISGESILYADANTTDQTQELITEILTFGSSESMGSTVVYPEAMPEEAALGLIKNMLNGDASIESGSIAIYPEVMAEKAAEQIISDILHDSNAEGSARVMAIEAAFVDSNAAQVIADILWVEPVAQAQQDAQGIPEDTAQMSASDILSSETGSDEPTAQPETLPESSEQLILEPETTPSEEATSNLPVDMAETIADMLTFEPESPVQADDQTTQKPDQTVAMTDEQIENTIASIIYGNVHFASEQGQGNEILTYADDLDKATETTEDTLLVFEGETALETKENGGTTTEEADGENNDQLAYEASDEQAAPDAGENAYSELPWVDVSYSADGDIIPGTTVTLTATVHNIDPSLNLQYQWENNASGTYQAVPFAAGRVYAFIADESNAQCDWRVSITAQ